MQRTEGVKGPWNYQREEPVQAYCSLQPPWGDPCLLGFTPLRAGFRREEKKVWWKWKCVSCKLNHKRPVLGFSQVFFLWVGSHSRESYVGSFPMEGFLWGWTEASSQQPAERVWKQILQPVKSSSPKTVISWEIWSPHYSAKPPPGSWATKTLWDMVFVLITLWDNMLHNSNWII